MPCDSPAALARKLAVITIFDAGRVRAAIEHRRALERERLSELIAAAEATHGPVDLDEVRANSAVFARARAGIVDG
ncbi:hypothetical protein E1264_36360 [Actinomadura sp. KC216]|uniref:hypothetical protein n=1 Tax=Actinomadura sp. KC216 TaxID=2530370 RepID=UPI001050995B|nr:hypothetical protein [Actinomadura sp. KC216]TDB78827.1 hypothetical protein E1264_36360 [Actinomadura sp. KC216]